MTTTHDNYVTAVPAGWIRVHDSQAPKKRSGVILVRADSIDSVEGRRTYTTLRVHGLYLHVTETAQEIFNKLEYVRMQ